MSDHAWEIDGAYHVCPRCGQRWLTADRVIGDGPSSQFIERGPCPATEKLCAEREIVVSAWWKDRQPVRCCVKSIHASVYGTGLWLDVAPLEGNPHWRTVKATDILGEER